jgi:hypothetical protein
LVEPPHPRDLQEAGLVDVVGLSYAASFASLPDQLIYCEHGNQFERLSRSPWNLSGGPELIRRHPPWRV